MTAPNLSTRVRDVFSLRTNRPTAGDVHGWLDDLLHEIGADEVRYETTKNDMLFVPLSPVSGVQLLLLAFISVVHACIQQGICSKPKSCTVYVLACGVSYNWRAISRFIVAGLLEIGEGD